MLLSKVIAGGCCKREKLLLSCLAECLVFTAEQMQAPDEGAQQTLNWQNTEGKNKTKTWNHLSDAELFTAAKFTMWKWDISCSFLSQIPTQCTSIAILVSAWSCCGEDLFHCSVSCSVSCRPEQFLAHLLQMLEGRWPALPPDFQRVSTLQEWAV